MEFADYNSSTPEFSLAGQELYGRVVEIYDGDTLKIVLPVLGHYFKFNARLMGIDTCEMKSKNTANRELAYKARNRLFELITNSSACDFTWKKKEVTKYLDDNLCVIKVKCYEFDKYGRVMIDCFTPERSVSDILIQEKLAYSYTGETKLTEEQQVEKLMYV